MKWFKQFICGLRDHAGIELMTTRTGRCKKCGKHLNLWKNKS